MRRFYLLSIILLIANVANAQVAKNKFLLGGNINYFEAENNDLGSSEDKRQHAGFGIEIGKALKENTVLGLSANYNGWNVTYTNDSIPEGYSDNFAVGVFYRKYKPLWKELYLFGQANATYFFGEDKNNYYGPTGGVKTNTQGGGLSFAPGVSYQIFRKIQASITLNNLISVHYDDVKRRSLGQNIKSHSFSFNTAFQTNFVNNLMLGFHLVL